MAKKCTPWTIERKSSGASLHTRKCGSMKATILVGTSVYTITTRDRGHRRVFVTRQSAKTVRAAKAAATRRMRR